MARMKDVRVGHIAPYPGLNTRRHFDEQKLQDLAASIRANGLLQPLVLHESENGDLLLIAGERRLRACRLISEDLEVPCTIKRYTEQELVEIMISENLQREDLTPVEEARAFRRALMLPGMTQKALAERVGVSQ